MDANGLNDRKELTDILQWYGSAGVDICIGETARNHFLENANIAGTARPSPRKDMQPAKTAKISKGPGQGTMAKAGIRPDTEKELEKARILAGNAKNLDEIKQALESFDGCSLKERASRTVHGCGNPSARIMLVGKAPSDEDELLASPFAGKAGQLLDAMLQSVSLTRDDVFLSNVVPWRPPGNRDPAPHEARACLPFLERQIELIGPELIVALGDMATRTLLGEQASVLKQDGEIKNMEIAGCRTRVMAMLHPQFLLRQPAQKQRTWRSLCKLRLVLEAGSETEDNGQKPPARTSEPSGAMAPGTSKPGGAATAEESGMRQKPSLPLR